LALELGADALGFVLEPSSKRSVLGNADALQIPYRLGPFALCVAVLGHYRPVPAQFHLVQSVDELPESEVRPGVKALRISANDTVDSVLAQIGQHPSVLLDAFAVGQFGGTGHQIDWQLAAEITARTRAKVILAGGLTPENVGIAIEIVRPYAVDVSGGVESTPGIKDASKLKAFFDAAKAEKLRER
jgi:phosphoribosylanthranilate isomerase